MSKLFLRELVESDVNENYLKGFSNPDVTEFLEVDGASLTKEEVIDYMNSGRATKSYFMYAICLSENKKQIGNLKIGSINYRHMTSDLVTVIWDREEWGKGYGTEAIKLGNSLAFEKYNIRKLSGGIYDKDFGAIKAYTRAGWVIEAKLQNQAIVNGEYLDKVFVCCFNPNYRTT